MNNLIICGKSNQEIPVSKLRKKKTDEVWLCGTDTREGADLYFELHGIKTPHKNVITKLGDEVYYNRSGISMGNTISGMMIYAWLHGYTHITLLGCPMLIKEYPQQRETVVRLYYYLNDNGVRVIWDDLNRKPEPEPPAPPPPPVKTVKARALGLICASFGTFEAGSLADIPEDNYQELLEEGLIESI